MDQCDRSWELDAVRDGRLSPSDVDSFERHRRTCATCGALAADAERLRRLGRSLVPDAPDDEVRVRRVRGRILRDAALAGGTAPMRPRFIVVLAAVLLAVVGVLVARSSLWTPRITLSTPGLVDSPEGERATVHPGPATTWSRLRDGATERIHLDDGTLALEVEHQRPGERFLVELPDGELEVRGTRFEVVVKEKVTRSVRVLEGRVALRRDGEPELLLVAGESWAPSGPAVAPSSAAVIAAAPPSSARALSPRPAASGDEVDYAHAIKLYRAGEYTDAARAFHAFGAAHRKDPEAEDASFLEAAALAQSGRGDAAALVAERFLELYPASIHAKDAAILVARAARDRGHCDAARRVLAPWPATSSVAVAAALGHCAP